MPPAVFLVLKSLLLQATERLECKVNITCVNERTENGDEYLRKIIARNDCGKKLVLISAKTFELPRAIDIAVYLKRLDSVDVVIGGAGVTLADYKTYELLRDKGISFNVGEGEETVGKIIEDALNNSLKILYWQRNYVDLREAPLPDVPDVISDGYGLTLNRLAGIDTSEGCPHNCSFCCVTTLRGRQMTRSRARDPEGVLEWIEKTHRVGLPIMLLDDNFRRSPIYRTLSEQLIRLNEKLGDTFYLFIQLDATPDVIKEVSALARMGVRQVFLGIETLDSQRLADEGKTHNKPEQYRLIVDEFHRYSILVNAGWMVGFPDQCAPAILKEARAMAQLFDLVALFRVVPFPETVDFYEAVRNGEIVDWDPNNYDTAHFVRKLSMMTKEEAEAACCRAFSINHSVRHILAGVPGLRQRVFQNNLYSRVIAEWGKLARGKPFQFIMDGIPRIAGNPVWRPEDSFRGFSLVLDDLDKREKTLGQMS